MRGTDRVKRKDRGQKDPQTDRWEAGWVKEDRKPVMAGETGQSRRLKERRAEGMMGV